MREAVAQSLGTEHPAREPDWLRFLYTRAVPVAGNAVPLVLSCHSSPSVDATSSERQSRVLFVKLPLCSSVPVSHYTVSVYL